VCVCVLHDVCVMRAYDSKTESNDLLVANC